MNKLVKRLIEGERGQALPIALALLALGGLTIAPSLSNAAATLQLTRVTANSIKSDYAADAGIEQSIWYLLNNSTPPTQVPGSINRQTVAVTTQSQGTYTLAFGQFVGLNSHSDYLSVSSQVGSSSPFTYTFTVGKTAASGNATIHLTEVGARLPTGSHYQAYSAASFPGNMSTAEPQISQDSSGTELLRWTLSPNLALTQSIPTATQAFNMDTDDGSGEYAWTIANRSDVGAVSDVSGSFYQITSIASNAGNVTRTSEAVVILNNGTAQIISWQSAGQGTPPTTPPGVTTNSATGITTTSTGLNGNLTSLGTASSVNVSFQWGLSPGVYPDTTTPQTKSTTGAFYFDLTGLSPGTTYYYRAQGVGQGTGFGGEQSFTTTSAGYSITATAGAGGSSTPSGTVNVVPGASQSFTITPNSGYHIDTLTVDGSAAPVAPTYTFTNVQANHTISATFAATNNLYAFPGNNQSSFWTYSISANTWTSLAAAPGNVQNGGALTYDGANYIYAFQGSSQTAFWRYSISANTWASLATAPGTVQAGAALRYDGANYVYAFRGNNSTAFWRYNISANSWTTLANAPANVLDGGSLAYGGSNYIYAFRGNNQKSFWRYNISANSWTTLANAPSDVQEGGSLAYDGSNYIYAFRGNDNESFWRYNVSANSWTTLASVPGDVKDGGALSYPGANYLYAFRGNNASSFWRYNISANSWTTLANAPANVNTGGALVAGN